MDGPDINAISLQRGGLCGLLKLEETIKQCVEDGDVDVMCFDIIVCDANMNPEGRRTDPYSFSEIKRARIDYIYAQNAGSEKGEDGYKD